MTYAMHLSSQSHAPIPNLSLSFTVSHLVILIGDPPSRIIWKHHSNKQIPLWNLITKTRNNTPRPCVVIHCLWDMRADRLDTARFWLCGGWGAGGEGEKGPGEFDRWKLNEGRKHAGRTKGRARWRGERGLRSYQVLPWKKKGISQCGVVSHEGAVSDALSTLEGLALSLRAPGDLKYPHYNVLQPVQKRIRLLLSVLLM